MASYNLNAKITTIENRVLNIDKNLDSKFINIQNQNKTITSVFSQRIETLDNRIKVLEESLKDLNSRYEANLRLINELKPIVGQKRKWWQI